MSESYAVPLNEFRWLNPTHKEWHSQECNGILQQKWIVQAGYGKPISPIDIPPKGWVKVADEGDIYALWAPTKNEWRDVPTVTESTESSPIP